MRPGEIEGVPAASRRHGLRGGAAGVLEAERQFRKISGYEHVGSLAVAVERHVTAEHATTTAPTPTRLIAA